MLTFNDYSIYFNQSYYTFFKFVHLKSKYNIYLLIKIKNYLL